MFHLYRSSRLERLADLLAAKLHGSRPYSVLSPQSIVVGHLGMKRWLTQRLAETSLGPLPRIAANLDMLLPSEWIDRLSSEVLGESNSATAQLRRDALRWRIFDVLGEQIDSGIVQYLQGADSARRRFQLADRLSGLYNQYLVYRSDWLCCWEGGSTRNVPDSVVNHWQGELWRRVVDTEVGHRGQRMGALVAALPSLGSDPEQPALHVFGLSHLPPDVLEALDRVSANRDVHLYFPDLCRELWEELHRRRDVYSTQLEGGEFLNLSHPLLANLGRMGQHHCLQLAALDPFEDNRDVADENLLPLQVSAGPLLSRLQNSIRMLQPDLITSDRRAADPRADASLRIHLCHTRLRELEVLKDALLDQLASIDDLHPREIVVMAPNMAAYAPLLPAVFGEPGKSNTTLPFHLADVSLRRTHPLLTVFADLLVMPLERVSRSQVLTLLGLPAVMRRFGLDDSKFAGLERWLQRSHVAWGLDGAMKADFGAAEIEANSFAFGFDRMAVGYLVGSEDPDWLLGDILPAHPVSGPDAQALGSLWAVLELLGEWRALSRQSLPLSSWADHLQGWIERLFLPDYADQEELEATNALARAVAGLTTSAAQAGVDPLVEWDVVREALVQALDSVPERQAFLAGGITFCGMVPQRSIPFRVIALLGLNDGEFPRTGSDSGLDLMRAHPRLGDRGNRMDDRYLFLEAIMSARGALHLSYVGEGVQDGKPRNPALPLAELLRFLDDQHGIDADDDEKDRPWMLKHAIQPFDIRYFTSNEPPSSSDESKTDPRWFSYSTEFASVQSQQGAGNWRFLRALSGSGDSDSGNVIELQSLNHFYKRPAEWLCTNVLSLSRRALDAEAEFDIEPLTGSGGPLHELPMALMWDALNQGQKEISITAPERLLRSGQLAAGEVGKIAYASIREQANLLLQGARALAPFNHGPAQRDPVAVDLRVGGERIVGSLNDVFRHGEELWLVHISTSKSMNFSKLLPLYLQWAALRLSRPTVRSHHVLLQLSAKGEPAQPHELAVFADGIGQLRCGLESLARIYRNPESVAGSYFPATSFAYAHATEDPLGKARLAWKQKRTTREGDYAPGYNALLGGEEDFLDETKPAHARFAEVSRRLYALISRDESSEDEHESGR